MGATSLGRAGLAVGGIASCVVEVGGGRVLLSGGSSKIKFRGELRSARGREV